MNQIYSHPNKLLKDHLTRVTTTGINIFKDKSGLKFSYDPVDTENLLKYLLLFHDTGKMTYYFQVYLLASGGQGDSFRENRPVKHPDAPAKAFDNFHGELDDYRLLKHKGLTNHGLVSAVITAYQVYCYFAAHPRRMWYTSLAFAIVRKHHLNLQDLEDILEMNRDDWKLVEQQLSYCDLDFFRTHFSHLIEVFDYNLEKLKNCIDEIEDFKWEIIDHSSIENFFYFNFLYSILLYSDKHEAIFSLEKDAPRQRIKPDIVDRYKQKHFPPDNSQLNQTREIIYRKVENSIKQLDKENKERIFSINVPTGSGKTLCSLNAALKIREQSTPTESISEANQKFLQGGPGGAVFTKSAPPGRRRQKKIIYCLPFTSIIDQNAEVFEKVLSMDFDRVTTDILLKHHHLTELNWSDQIDEYTGDKAEFLIETWNSELVVTTFWQFFHTLFTNKNSHLKRFHQLANSIIILDEIQAIPVRYWTLLKKALTQLAHLFNSKIILVTATMPLIFSETQKEILELVTEKENHFQTLNRVKLSIDSEKKDVNAFAEELKEKIKPDRRYLIILNTIGSSLQLYNLLKEYKPLYLSTNIIPLHRQERIKYLKKKSKGDIVVSTQLVEAGVDIDFDVVYRDIAPLDSINQGAGRCNRENQMDRAGEVRLVHLVSNDKLYASYIYDQILLHTTTEIFKSAFGSVKHRGVLFEKTVPVKHPDPPAKAFDSERIIYENQFFEIAGDYFERLTRVVSQQASDKLLQYIEAMKYEGAFTGKDAFRLIDQSFERENIFVEVDKEAGKVLETYRQIRQIKDRWQRKNEFNKIKNRFSQYIISIANQTIKKNPPPVFEDSDFYFVPYGQLAEYYDIETGFKTEGSTSIW
ncbi:MAG: CRISPR-associated helicase Cas3' [Candidatus Aminicenantes bacterium]|jgi:CRISPR-associated endonuclease/helicase Cas3